MADVYLASDLNLHLGVAELKRVFGSDFKSKRYALVGQLDDVAGVFDDNDMRYMFW